MSQEVASSMAGGGNEQPLLGESSEIARVRDLVARFAPAPVPVLIQGETGSGKELVARAIHSASGRRGALVPVNVCAIAEPMFEDALFGHARGAFTGAATDLPGFLLEANGGTIFLDEIGGLGLPQQAKLLRALETKSFRPVGASRERRSDFRLVSATNEPLPALVATGRFRADLAQRLAAAVIDVPALRERASDIPVLTRHFLLHAPRGIGRVFSAAAMERLVNHRWPGNVRELRNVVEMAALLSDNRVIDVDAIEARLAVAPAPLPPPVTMQAERSRAVVHETMRALEGCGGDVLAAARELGVHPATVYRRLKKHSR